MHTTTTAACVNNPVEIDAQILELRVEALKLLKEIGDDLYAAHPIPTPQNLKEMRSIVSAIKKVKPEFHPRPLKQKPKTPSSTATAAKIKDFIESCRFEIRDSYSCVYQAEATRWLVSAKKLIADNRWMLENPPARVRHLIPTAQNIVERLCGIISEVETRQFS